MYVVNRKEIFFAINLIPVSLYALIIVSHFLADFYGEVLTSNKNEIIVRGSRSSNRQRLSPDNYIL